MNKPQQAVKQAPPRVVTGPVSQLRSPLKRPLSGQPHAPFHRPAPRTFSAAASRVAAAPTPPVRPAGGTTAAAAAPDVPGSGQPLHESGASYLARSGAAATGGWCGGGGGDGGGGGCRTKAGRLAAKAAVEAAAAADAHAAANAAQPAATAPQVAVAAVAKDTVFSVCVTPQVEATGGNARAAGTQQKDTAAAPGLDAEGDVHDGRRAMKRRRRQVYGDLAGMDGARPLPQHSEFCILLRGLASVSILGFLYTGYLYAYIYLVSSALHLECVPVVDCATDPCFHT